MQCLDLAAARLLRLRCLWESSQWADDVALQAPEIQTMYNVPFPVSVIRTRIREEFERNRFVNKLPIVDVLLFKSDAEYQVKRAPVWAGIAAKMGTIGLTHDDRKP